MDGETGGEEGFVLMDLITVDGLKENRFVLVAEVFCWRSEEALYVGNEEYVGHQCWQ